MSDAVNLPSSATRRLDALVGRWSTEGRVVAADSEPVPVSGTDTYEWLDGSFFIVHHIDVVVGRERVVGIEMIGEHDPATDTYAARSYDNRGDVVDMTVSVDKDGVWTFTGGPDAAAAAAPIDTAEEDRVRSTLRIASDRRTMTAEWERSTDGSSWRPWMHVNFTSIP